MKIRRYLEKSLDDHTTRHFMGLQVFLAIVTIISILSIILETVPSLARFDHIMMTVEWICVLIFTLEYIARLVISKNKLRYIFSAWGIIDLVSILPTYLHLGNLTFLKSVRALRIQRYLRILRIAKISRAYLQTRDVQQSEAEATLMNFVIYFLALFSAVIAFGAALYAVEHTQADYSSIPLSMLQSARILLGGIGETPPKSIAGEIIMIFTRLGGLALFGLLISVIGTTLNKWLFGHHGHK
jgi:voltage-gated potassium channel